MVNDSGVKVNELQLSYVSKEVRPRELEVNDHVGTQRIMGKKKPIMYDQTTDVTKEKLKYQAMLDAEEKNNYIDLPTLDYEGPENEENEEKKKGKKKEEFKANYLNEKELNKIFDNPKFQKFLENTEDTLTGIMEDKIPLVEDIMDHESPDMAEDLRQKLSEPIVISDSTSKTNGILNTKDYLVSEIQSIPQGIVAAYALREPVEGNTNAGQVVVWNTDNNEAVFIGQTKHKLNKIYCAPSDGDCKDIWGGQSNGQVVKWEISEKNEGISKPVLKSKPCLQGNFFPIYGIFGYDKPVEHSYGGFRDPKRIITISNDGKCCIWKEHDLTVPDSVLNQKFASDQNRTTDRESYELPLAVMKVQLVDEHVYIGTFDKILHKFNISDFFSGNEIVSESVYFTGHQAPIGTMSYLDCKSMNDLSEIVDLR